MDRTTTMRVTTPNTRLRAAIAAAPKFRSPGLHLELLRDTSWKTHVHFYPIHSSPTCLFRHILTSMVYISFIRRVGVSESCVTWSSGFWISQVALGAVAWIACCFRYSVSSLARRFSTYFVVVGASVSVRD
ncbi:hypothetical protein F5888DRAFT_255761 [Russula emetica]|nr:hypothetical protein F5888DRAFT_255761 [Russula emetica]